MSAAPQLPTTFDRVVLIADPGTPTKRAEAAKDELAERLARELGQEVSVEVRSATLRLTPEFELDMEAAEELAELTEPAHATVFLTEIPRHTRGHPLIAEVFTLFARYSIEWTLQRLAVLSKRSCVALLCPREEYIRASKVVERKQASSS